MCKLLSFIIIIIGIQLNTLQGQSLIAVQNGNNVSFHSQVISAINAAANGDTIYIPGGSWSMGPLTLDKSIHIIGVGHNPDSAIGGLITLLNGNFYLSKGASNGSISGCSIDGIVASNHLEQITNYTIYRNIIAGSLVLSSASSFCTIHENIILSVLAGSNNAPYPSNNFFFNNIIRLQFYYFGPGNVFKNNIFLSPQNAGGNQINNCVFENNIFLDGFFNYINNGIINSIFSNNIFMESITIPYATNLGTNNIKSQAPIDIFHSWDGNFNFQYSDNYHLKASSQGKNGGTDGKDIGIYGGLFPWKDGSLPSNPHVQYKQISSTTDQNGNLQINMVVKAQNN